jgi:hypothetical protein
VRGRDGAFQGGSEHCAASSAVREGSCLVSVLECGLATSEKVAEVNVEKAWG